jgi:3-deoxy-manno-octulosonate cytidylyltransferase (CMP-KDO synthetase)
MRGRTRCIVLEFDVPAVPVTRWPFGLTESSVLAIIPARYHSTRLPGKALLDINGRPMIEHVYRRASEARSISGVVVATDDERIASAVERFGGTAFMTSPDHPSATDRLAELVATVSCGLVVNVQGDEPLLDASVIDATVEAMLGDDRIDMATAARRVRSDELANPNLVKVVTDREGFALYFSRSAIPYGRDQSAITLARGHIGLYVYRRDVLLRLAQLAPTPLEQAEALEQLRALEHGIRIKVVETSYESIGVDTAEDLERVRTLAKDGQ